MFVLSVVLNREGRMKGMCKGSIQGDVCISNNQDITVKWCMSNKMDQHCHRHNFHTYKWSQAELALGLLSFTSQTATPPSVVGVVSAHLASKLLANS